MENTHKYQTQTQEMKEAFLNNLTQTRDDLNNGNFVAKDSIKQDKELINLNK